jgi:hypothetical protein
VILRATISTLARCLGVRDDQAESVLRSEASARAALSRRGLFRAAGAVAAGVAFGDVVPTLPAQSPWDLWEVDVTVDGNWMGSLAPLWSRDAIARALTGQRAAIVLPPGLRMRHVPEPSASPLAELFEESP